MANRAFQAFPQKTAERSAPSVRPASVNPGPIRAQAALQAVYERPAVAEAAALHSSLAASPRVARLASLQQRLFDSARARARLGDADGGAQAHGMAHDQTPLHGHKGIGEQQPLQANAISPRTGPVSPMRISGAGQAVVQRHDLTTHSGGKAGDGEDWALTGREVDDAIKEGPDCRNKAKATLRASIAKRKDEQNPYAPGTPAYAGHQSRIVHETGLLARIRDAETAGYTPPSAPKPALGGGAGWTAPTGPVWGGTKK
jgi:hypothetical protein